MAGAVKSDGGLSLRGSLSVRRQLTGAISGTGSLSGAISVAVGTGQIYPPYEGAYSVTPMPKGVTLPTAKKLMMEDLTVQEIPVYRVGNTAGGDTVYIACADEIKMQL